jgi:hypothetical protein
MPAIDECQPKIINALAKAGWQVNEKPFILRLNRQHRLHIDLEARNQQGTILVIEVKYFAETQSATTDLYLAIGQYIVYRSLLRERDILEELFLAIPLSAYQDIFQRMGMSAIVDNDVKMIIVDLDTEVIHSWRR